MEDFRIGEIVYCVNADGSVTAEETINTTVHGIVIPEMIEHENKKYKVITIGKLSRCTGVTIPSSVTSIRSLYWCDNITIPLSVISIGVLMQCKNINIPSSVNIIRSIRACQGITLPSSITSIGSLLCSWGDGFCSLVGSLIITIPSSVLTISEIDGEKGSMLLRMESFNPPSVGKVTNMSKDDQLVVPQGALEAYKNDLMWGKFKNIREDPSLGKGVALTQQQLSVANNGAVEKEKAELKSQLEKKDEEIAGLKKQLAKKDEEIAELKRQLDAKKASEPSKPQPAPVRPTVTAQLSTSTVPSAKGVFKLDEYKSKGKLCHTIVKTYVERHPDVTLAQLKQVFNVPKCDAIVESLEKAMTMTDSSGKAGGCHYIKEAEQIKIKEGIVVVWSYWPERYYPDFIANAKKAGFTIE